MSCNFDGQLAETERLSGSRASAMRLVLKFGRTDRREGEIKPVEFLYDVIPHVEFASALSGESAGLKESVVIMEQGGKHASKVHAVACFERESGGSHGLAIFRDVAGQHASRGRHSVQQSER